MLTPQVRNNPYMPPSEYDDVVRDHELASLRTASIHARLYQQLQVVEARGKKATRRNVMLSLSNNRAQFAADWLFNYNTVRGVAPAAPRTSHRAMSLVCPPRSRACRWRPFCSSPPSSST